MHPPFTMSKYATTEALYRDKASYYEQLAKTLAANADNENLSDADFRKVVRNSTPEFKNIDTGDAPLDSKGLMIEIVRRRALIEGQLLDIEALRRQHADAESREFIAEHGIKADMVQSSDEGGHHWTAQEFGHWMRKTGCAKPWAEWNGRLYPSDELKVGKLRHEAPGIAEHVPA